MTAHARQRDCGNTLLDRLSAVEFDALEPILETVPLTLRQIVHQQESKITHVHFPTTALISLLVVLEEDDPVEAATVGREGFIGLGVSQGVDLSLHRALCQMGGESLRLPVALFREAMGRGPVLSHLIRRYGAYALRRTSQGIACNTLHTVEARACRWLLIVHDQAGGGDFPMTHEFMAFMLGVRRQGVTVVAGVLQNAGLIDYRRGRIVVLDRGRLEEAACECYATVRAYYERVVN